MRIRLDEAHELGAAPRLGGNFTGPTDATLAIWKGRPPTYLDGVSPNVLSIAMRSSGTLPPGAIRSVTIKAECGNGFGGIITREFNIGEGLSCDLGVGAFHHVKVRTASPLPESCILYFCWVHELNFSSSVMTLSNFLNYPIANTRVRAPEGAFEMIPENACQITWTLDQYGTTFTQGIAAGQSIAVRWGTFSCNVPNKFFFRLRGF